MQIELTETELRVVVKALLAVTDQLTLTGSRTESQTLRAIVGKIVDQALEQATQAKVTAIAEYENKLNAYREQREKELTLATQLAGLSNRSWVSLSDGDKEVFLRSARETMANTVESTSN